MEGAGPLASGQFGEAGLVRGKPARPIKEAGWGLLHGVAPWSLNVYVDEYTVFAETC